MSVFIGIVSRDRPELLEFCVRFLTSDLGSGRPTDVEIMVVDNSRELRERAEWPIELRERGYTIGIVKPAVVFEDPSVEAANMELGESRRVLTECFLASQHQWLLILDDDILVTLRTVLEAVADLEALADMGVGAVGLHPFPKRLQSARFQIGDRAFRAFDYSSDCCLLLSRATLERTGVRFGPDQGGYANLQFQALADAGLYAVTRISPAYAVQHLGVEGLAGSLIYASKDQQPAWTKKPFTDYLTNDVLYYEILALWRRLGLTALVRQLKGEGNEMRQHEHAVRERGPAPAGRLEIEVQDKTGRVVRTVHVQNLCVTNAKTIMANLLGGGGAAAWAITRMAFGTGTTAPVEADTTLEVAITPVKVTTADYPDSSSVRFTATLESDEANGFPVSEAGLYTPSNGMFARVTFGPLNKSEDFRFVYRWTIYW